MKRPPTYWNKGKKYLARKDRVMAKLFKSYKGHLITRNDFFFSITKSIISQQVSVSAASSIFSKFKKKCKGKINPKIVSKISLTSLRRCGLSRQKARGIKSLAKKILNKSFNPKLIKDMSDEEAIVYLSSLRQIGRWTSQMILLFCFNRQNIWPAGTPGAEDIGLLKGISMAYKKKYPVSKKFVEKLRKKFSPYASIACWFLWRCVDSEIIQY